MKRLMFIAVAALALAGCQMYAAGIPEDREAVAERKPFDPDRGVAGHPMVDCDYEVGTDFCNWMDNYSGFCDEEKNSQAQAKHDRLGRGWMKYFTYACECTWPVGSSCRCFRPIGRISIRNTEENHEYIRKLLAGLREEQLIVELRARFVKVGQETLDDIGASRFPGKEKGRRYDISEFKSIPAGEFERLLVARRDLIGNEMSEVSTKLGDEAIIKFVTEYIYPTDYEVQMGERLPCGSNETVKVNSCGVATVEPRSFTMREVGTILDVTPKLFFDRSAIGLSINTVVVDKPEWNEYGMDVPSPNGGSYRLPMKQPFFHTRSVDASYSLAPGDTVLAGSAVKSGESSDITELVFVTIRLLDLDGREVKLKAK